MAGATPRGRHHRGQALCQLRHGRVPAIGTVGGDFAMISEPPVQYLPLTFPNGLQLKAGGHVEIGFTSDGPGTIFVSVNGTLNT